MLKTQIYKQPFTYVTWRTQEKPKETYQISRASYVVTINYQMHFHLSQWMVDDLQLLSLERWWFGPQSVATDNPWHHHCHRNHSSQHQCDPQTLNTITNKRENGLKINAVGGNRSPWTALFGCSWALGGYHLHWSIKVAIYLADSNG